MLGILGRESVEYEWMWWFRERGISGASMATEQQSAYCYPVQ